MKTVVVGTKQPVTIGGRELVIICGPCVIESAEHAKLMSGSIREITARVGLPLIYKSSYEKANRTSGSSFRGLGIDAGLRVLEEVRRDTGLPVVTDVHTESEAEIAGKVVDLVQIPAFLCRQTSLLEAAGKTGKPVLIKKGQFLHPSDMRFAAEKVERMASGAGEASTAGRVVLCERGACFGYRELVVDFRSLGIMRDLGYPVVFDATHSVQVMGGENGRSGGAREWVPPLARAAAAFGIDALFLECHEDPDRAPSDGPNMVPLVQLEKLLTRIKRVREAAAE